MPERPTAARKGKAGERVDQGYAALIRLIWSHDPQIAQSNSDFGHYQPALWTYWHSVKCHMPRAVDDPHRSEPTVSLMFYCNASLCSPFCDLLGIFFLLDACWTNMWTSIWSGTWLRGFTQRDDRAETARPFIPCHLSKRLIERTEIERANKLT